MRYILSLLHFIASPLPLLSNCLNIKLIAHCCLVQSLRCTCPEGFDGPRCQQTRHSFSGDGWAWSEPLGQCEDRHTSLKFMTLRENGLLVYQGPMRDLAENDPEDFLIMEMKGGYPLLRINHGTGEMKLTVDGRDKHGVVKLGKLDGHWHQVDIFKSGKVRRNLFKLSFLSCLLLGS